MNEKNDSDWSSKIPRWVKLGVGLVTSIITLIILVRGNIQLGATVGLSLLLLAVLVTSLYIVFSRVESPIVPGETTARYPRHKVLGQLGILLVAAAFATLFLWDDGRSYLVAGIVGTATPIPTPSPTPFAQADSDESLIVISPFVITKPESIHAHDLIQAELKRTISELDLKEVRVEIDSNAELSLGDQEAAQALGELHDATLVIWGTVSQDVVIVNFLNVRNPKFSAANEAVKIWEPESRAVAMAWDMPNMVSFLSLFAISQTLYLDARYIEASRALQRAVSSLPEEDIEASNQYRRISVEAILDALFLLGWLYQEPLSRPEQALEAYSKGLDIDSSRFEYYYNRGLVYQEQNDFERALADYTAALRLNPDLVPAYYNRASISMTLGDFPQALEDLDKAITLDPNHLEARYARATIALNQHKYAEAIADFSIVIEQDNAHIEALYGRSIAHYSLGDFHSAIQDLDTAVSLDPARSDIYYFRATTLVQLGEYESAERDYRLIVESLDPSNAVAHNDLAWLYADILGEKLDKAILLAQRAVQLAEAQNLEANTLSVFLDTLGWAYYKVGDTQAAINYLNQALAFAGDESTSHRTNVLDHLSIVLEEER